MSNKKKGKKRIRKERERERERESIKDSMARQNAFLPAVYLLMNYDLSNLSFTLRNLITRLSNAVINIPRNVAATAAIAFDV